MLSRLAGFISEIIGCNNDDDDDDDNDEQGSSEAAHTSLNSHGTHKLEKAAAFFSSKLH